MKLLLLAHEAPGDFSQREDKTVFDGYMGAWFAFSEEMKKSGATIDSAPLDKPDTATVVSVRDGVRKVEDGPYPDAREQLGGYFMIEVDDLDAGAVWAQKCPAAKNGYVDVRAIPDFEENGQ